MNLLLAIDDSPSAERAVREVVARPWPAGTQVRVLSVSGVRPGVPMPPMPAATGPFMPYPRDVGAAEADETYPSMEASRRIAQRGVDELTASGLQAKLRIRDGSPGTEIVEEAEAWPADLIVVGSRGFGAVKRTLLGSVADYVLHNAHCSVEVVRERKSG